MPFDAEAPAFTTTSHRAAALTAASALALYQGATSRDEKLRAAAAMAEVLRAQVEKAPKAKAKATPSDLLSAETLAAVLKRACAIIERKSTIPILSCVLLESDGARLKVTATDLDMQFCEQLRGELPAFSLAAPAHELLAFLAGVKGPVEFEDATDQTFALSVRAGGAEVRLPCLHANDFPIMGPMKDEVTATMSAAAMLAPLRFIAGAISSEETRYYLNGALMAARIEDGQERLTFVATDGSQLRLDRTSELKDFGGFSGPLPEDGVLIPRKAVEWLLKHGPAGADDIQVDVSPQRIRVTTYAFTVETKLIDGRFPDYPRVIPREDALPTVTRVRAPNALKDAMKKIVAHAAKERAASFTLDLDPVTGAKASRRDLEGGKLEMELLGVEVTGEATKAAFNARFFQSIVAMGDALTIRGPADAGVMSHPALFTWDAQPNRLAVLMPLRP